jgi:hypothetical protein
LNNKSRDRKSPGEFLAEIEEDDEDDSRLEQWMIARLKFKVFLCQTSVFSKCAVILSAR